MFGLVAADFEVRVAGKVQTIEFFEPPREPPRAGRERRRAGPTPRSASPARRRRSSRRARRATSSSAWTSSSSRRGRSYEPRTRCARRSTTPAAGRYGLATHFGGVSARVWDSDSADSILVEADAHGGGGRRAAESGDVAHEPAGASAASRHPCRPWLPLQYEERQVLEEHAHRRPHRGRGTPAATPADQSRPSSQYLAAERRRVKASVENLRETRERLAGARRSAAPLHTSPKGSSACPGFNFLSRLKAEETASLRLRAAPAGGASLRGAAAPPWAPGADQARRSEAGSRSTRARSSRWTSSRAGSRRPGVIVHYLDPSPLGHGPSDRRGSLRVRVAASGEDEAKNLQDTPLRFASETGGLDAPLRERPLGRARATSSTRRARRTASACAFRAWTRRRRTP